MQTATADSLLRGWRDDLVSGRLSLAGFREAVTGHVLSHIRCSEVSIWRFTGPVGQRRLVCVAANSRAEGWHRRPYDDLYEAQFGEYFDELSRKRVVRSDDAWADPRLAGFRDSLIERDVRALLDVSFAVNGHVHGVICCEQMGEPRTWTAAETHWLRRFATALSTQIARARGADQWEKPLPVELG
ncbi:GAF domain-containing protein [Caldimonas sp.]|uniref:GAF domain-containing protein n=1 Tax=Caldimonas sp. TaxID=2838790 RepID=UPI00391D5B47